MNTRQRGFTLIELIVVTAILGILISTALPAYRVFRQRAVGSEALLLMKQILDGQIVYFLEHEEYYPGPGDMIEIYQNGVLMFNGSPSATLIDDVRDALHVTIPIKHMLDFVLINDGAGAVWIQIDANFPLFLDGSSGVHAKIDNKGTVTYF
jgi:prepilin-type N-terminal cleavage/methylation domain-containing protein